MTTPEPRLPNEPREFRSAQADGESGRRAPRNCRRSPASAHASAQRIVTGTGAPFVPARPRTGRITNCRPGGSSCPSGSALEQLTAVLQFYFADGAGGASPYYFFDAALPRRASTVRGQKLCRSRSNRSRRRSRRPATVRSTSRRYAATSRSCPRRSTAGRWCGSTTRRRRKTAGGDRPDPYFYEHENSTSTARPTNWPPARPTPTKMRVTPSPVHRRPRSEDIVFVRGTTEAINLVAQSGRQAPG